MSHPGPPEPSGKPNATPRGVDARSDGATARGPQLARESFLRARDLVGGEDLDLVVGGLGVRVCFAGPGMRPRVEPALAHLARPAEGRPELTVLVWDSASTGVELPALSPDEASASDSHLSVYQAGAGLLTVLDREGREAIVWAEDAAAVPSNEDAAPLRVAFHLAFADRDRHVVHGGGVGRGSDGVLVAGRSGAGKSTVALACLQTGFDFAGDDYVLLAAGRPPRAHSLYCSAKLELDQLARFRGLADGVINPDELGREKPVINLSACVPERLTTGFALRAIVLPQVCAGESALRRVPASAALTAVAPSTIFQLPGTGAHTLRRLASLLAPLPCFVLESGPDLHRIPLLIDELLDGYGHA